MLKEIKEYSENHITSADGRAAVALANMPLHVEVERFA
jgi:hypothetical protein